MSHVRKIIALILTIIFVCAAAICAGIVFSVKNVNVSYIDYSGEYIDEYESSIQKLNAIKGTNILFLADGDVRGCVDGEHVRLVSYEKILPCTVNVVIAEKIETFAIYDGTKYAVYDDGGEFVRFANDNLNNVDQSPNILLENVADKDVKIVADALAKFKSRFGYARSFVEKISLGDSAVNNRIIFNLRCGLTVEIAEYTTLLNEKMSAVYNKYCSLSESEKITGKILCYSLQSATTDVKVIYTQN